MAQETPEQTIARLTAELEAKQRLVDDQNTIITEQSEVIANAEAAQTQAEVIIVSYEQKQYRVLAKQFNINGKVVKAAELAQDKESLKYLVEKKSGLLQLVEKAPAKAKAKAAAGTETEA